MRGEPVVFDDFRGGVNFDAAPYSIDTNQARDNLNGTVTPIGSFKKRNGFQTIASPTLPVTSLGTYERGTTKYLVAIGDSGASTDIYSITSGGTVTSRKGAATVTTGRQWAIIQAPASGGQGPTYMMNGSDPVLQWTGSGNVATWTASTGSVPNGKYMIYHDNRVMVAGVETDYQTRSTLYSCNLADPRDWASPGGATTLLDPDDGEEITALSTVGPYPLVAKAHKLFVVHDSDALAYRNVSDEFGCIANKSMVPTDIGTFFLTADRKIAHTDGSSVDIISTPIESQLSQILGADIGRATAHYHDNKYRISVSINGGVNDTIFEYDIPTTSWRVHKIYLTDSTTTAVTAWAQLDPSGANTLYCSGSSTATPKVFEAYKADIYTDLVTQPYRCYWDTGWNTYGQPHIRKIMRQVRLDSLGNPTFSYARSFASAFTSDADYIWETAGSEGGTTFGGSGTFGGTGTYGDGVNLVRERHYFTLGVARAWSFRFETFDSQDFELYSYTTAIGSRSD